MPPALEEALAAARRAAARPVMVQTQQALEAAAAEWLNASTIGLDTEFVRERTFFAQPGLIQISDGNTVWLVDPLALADHAPIKALLDSGDCVKILHSVGEDLEVLRQMTGRLPDPLFDTQIAAALTGRPMQMAYERLVEEILGESLPGGKARSNWLQRPLPADLVGYAAQDVAFLPLLETSLRTELEALGRLDWLREDCARVIAGARNPPEVETAWTRVHGATRLESDDECCRLMELAAWRERQAIRRDRPRRFIVKDEPLLEIARQAPRDAGALREISGLPDSVARRHEKELLELARQPVPQSFSRPPALDKLDAQQREQLRELQARVRKIAEKLGLEPPVIASKRDLVDWLQNEAPEWLEGWRGGFLEADSAKIRVSRR